MEKKTFRCTTCLWRRYAENHPEKLLARLWRWHTGWCPRWKAYKKASDAGALPDEALTGKRG